MKRDKDGKEEVLLASVLSYKSFSLIKMESRFLSPF